MSRARTAFVLPGFDLAAQIRAAANHAAHLRQMERAVEDQRLRFVAAQKLARAERRRATLGTAAETVVDAICAVLPASADAAVDLPTLRQAVNARLQRETALTGINSAASGLAREQRISRIGKRGHYRYFNPHREIAP